MGFAFCALVKIVHLTISQYQCELKVDWLSLHLHFNNNRVRSHISMQTGFLLQLHLRMLLLKQKENSRNPVQVKMGNIFYENFPRFFNFSKSEFL